MNVNKIEGPRLLQTETRIKISVTIKISLSVIQ